MFKRFVFLFLVGSLLINNTAAQTPTWNADVANIVFNNCSSCHHVGGIAPFALMSYGDAVLYAPIMESAIVDGTMPPWPPDPEYVHFKDERVLSETEINTLLDWLNEGRPEGDGSPPSPPVFTIGSQLSSTDHTLNTPEYTVVELEDEYRTFVIPSGLTETKYINTIEYLIGNPAIVHHILLWQDTSDVSMNLDLADPAPGFASNGAMAPSEFTKMLGAWAPGDKIDRLPLGMGLEVNAGADLVIEFHYAQGSEGQTDATEINFEFSETAFTRPVWVDPILYHFAPCFQEPLFYIPANTVQTFHEIFDEEYDYDLSFISAAPHMHNIGTSFRAYAKTPLNDSIPLININNWDFHWQGGYTYQKLVKIPKNTKLYGIANYDNTSANPNNPSDPPVDVWLGEETTDEMMLCFFAYTFYLPGDENVILDSALLETAINDPENILFFSIHPNPVSAELQIVNQNPEGKDYKIKIVDVYGKIILEDNMQFQTIKKLNIADIASGIYFLLIEDNNKIFTEKFIKLNP